MVRLQALERSASIFSRSCAEIREFAQMSLGGEETGNDIEERMLTCQVLEPEPCPLCEYRMHQRDSNVEEFQATKSLDKLRVYSHREHWPKFRMFKLKLKFFHMRLPRPLISLSHVFVIVTHTNTPFISYFRGFPVGTPQFGRDFTPRGGRYFSLLHKTIIRILPFPWGLPSSWSLTDWNRVYYCCIAFKGVEKSVCKV